MRVHIREPAGRLAAQEARCFTPLRFTAALFSAILTLGQTLVAFGKAFLALRLPLFALSFAAPASCPALLPALFPALLPPRLAVFPVALPARSPVLSTHGSPFCLDPLVPRTTPS